MQSVVVEGVVEMGAHLMAAGEQRQMTDESSKNASFATPTVHLV